MEQPSHKEGSTPAWIWCKFTIFLLITWQETASEVPKFTSHSFNSGISSRVHRNYHRTQTRLLPFYQFPGRQKVCGDRLGCFWGKYGPEGLGLWDFTPLVRPPCHHLAGAGERREGTKGIITARQWAQLSFFFFLFNSYIEMEFLKNVHLACPFWGFFVHSQILATSIVNFGIFSSLPN